MAEASASTGRFAFGGPTPTSYTGRLGVAESKTSRGSCGLSPEATSSDIVTRSESSLGCHDASVQLYSSTGVSGCSSPSGACSPSVFIGWCGVVMGLALGQNTGKRMIFDHTRRQDDYKF